MRYRSQYGDAVQLPNREALTLWMIRYVQDRDHADGIEVRKESAWDFHVLGGILERVRRAARAYLVLEKRGYGVEGRLVVRSAIEHAVTAQWAYLTPDGIDRLQVKMMLARRTYGNTARDKDDPEWVEVMTRIERQIPKNPDGTLKRGMPKFTGPDGVLETMDNTGYLRRGYSVLSRAGHVTDQAVTDYFAMEDNGTMAIADRPAEDHAAPVFHTLAMCCSLSAWVLARLEGDERGIELASSQGLLHRLDTHLKPSLRRFPHETK